MDRMVGVPNGSLQPGADERLRLKVRVGGIVQGVGFRPFVYRLANRDDLSGYILNDPQGVEIEVEGSLAGVSRFMSSLVAEKPPRARIDSVQAHFVDTLGETAFVIRTSEGFAERTALVSPDIATCPDCLGEIADPRNRRHRYPFTNCTNCGPRYTIIRDIPYDRKNTTMDAFRMCPACLEEYQDPHNRRFHAEPNACPVCGPAITLRDSSGQSVGGDPIRSARAALREGRVVAVRGLGGFHLAVDATSEDAVRRLRQRKHREEKPLAIMAADLTGARAVAEASQAEIELLTSPARPIVLLRKKPDSSVAESVAPGNKYLGVMLPYTPIHHLLMEGGGEALVMTSGNLSEEPIAIDMADAVARLGGITDLYLDHNRPIVSRCDDSVMRVLDGAPLFLRRSRGWAPLPIAADRIPMPILGCGGHLKNTVALSRGDQVFVSQHVGDLENLAAYEFFTSTVAHLQDIADVRPQVVAYDLHPDYLSTRFAHELGCRAIGVQHHHAHIVSCLGEAGLDGPVIGIALDGTGYGPDGTVWGGEVLVADRRSYRRVGRLEQVRLPGGDAAVREVWRMALAHLHSAFGDDLGGSVEEVVSALGVDAKRASVVLAMLRKGVNSPLTSSCGRLFDAVSSICGVRQHSAYEGQAALELEMAAAEDVSDAYPVAIESNGGMAVLALKGLIRSIWDDVRSGLDRAVVSARFHNWLVRGLTEMACSLAVRHGVRTVVLSGGCFQNAYLLKGLSAELRESGLEVVVNRHVPANDGGISFGQVLVAAARLSQG